jgi:hypothetical protein
LELHSKLKGTGSVLFDFATQFSTAQSRHIVSAQGHLKNHEDRGDIQWQQLNTVVVDAHSLGANLSHSSSCPADCTVVAPRLGGLEQEPDWLLRPMHAPDVAAKLNV